MCIFCNNPMGKMTLTERGLEEVDIKSQIKEVIGETEPTYFDMPYHAVKKPVYII